jgi:hypothetical protein
MEIIVMRKDLLPLEVLQKATTQALMIPIQVAKRRKSQRTALHPIVFRVLIVNESFHGQAHCVAMF